MSSSRAYIDLEHVVHDRHTVLTVGFFDGIHRGHQAVLQQVTTEADRLDARPLVVTFDRPPKAVLLGTTVPLLTTLEEKAELISRLGIGNMLVIPFDRAFAELDPEAFVRSVLVERIGVQEVVLGYDHRFGRGGSGDIEAMRRFGSELGFGVQAVSAEALDGITFSSTRIRQMLTDDGDVETASRHLGRYYSLKGQVVRGDGRGKKIGFPTANLRMIEEIKVVPKVGVYAVFVKPGLQNDWHRGVMNIGYRPTVTEGTDLVAEVHVLDFDDDLYGQTVELAFVRRLRSEKRFDSLDGLVSQIREDLVDCIAVLETVHLPD